MVRHGRGAGIQGSSDQLRKPADGDSGHSIDRRLVAGQDRGSAAHGRRCRIRFRCQIGRWPRWPDRWHHAGGEGDSRRRPGDEFGQCAGAVSADPRRFPDAGVWPVGQHSVSDLWQHVCFNTVGRLPAAGLGRRCFVGLGGGRSGNCGFVIRESDRATVAGPAGRGSAAERGLCRHAKPDHCGRQTAPEGNAAGDAIFRGLVPARTPTQAAHQSARHLLGTYPLGGWQYRWKFAWRFGYDRGRSIARSDGVAPGPPNRASRPANSWIASREVFQGGCPRHAGAVCCGRPVCCVRQLVDAQARGVP